MPGHRIESDPFAIARTTSVGEIDPAMLGDALLVPCLNRRRQCGLRHEIKGNPRPTALVVAGIRHSQPRYAVDLKGTHVLPIH